MKMKNKKAEQRADRQRHRERLKARRRSEPLLERDSPSLSKNPTILIVCEGRNTEPSYFNQFRLSSATVKPVGEGYNTISLVNRAIQLQQDGQYDQVWCVFDADPKPENSAQASNFNAAINLAESKGFGIAYSNQAFEYWIILHLSDHQGGGMHRNDYNDKINEYLQPHNVNYDGNNSKIISEELFEILDGVDEKTDKRRVELAITRAKRNYDKFDHSNPAEEESSTTVFRLVEELLKYL